MMACHKPKEQDREQWHKISMVQAVYPLSINSCLQCVAQWGILLPWRNKWVSDQ